MAILQYLPFLLLIVVANYGERDKNARLLTFVGLGLLDAALTLGGLGCLGLGWMLQHTDPTSYSSPQAIPQLFASLNWPLLGASLIGMGLLATIVLLPPVRRGLGHLLPITATSCMDCLALCFTVYYIGFTFVQITLLGGLDNLAQIQINLTAVELLLSGASLVLFALLGIGWLIRRNGKQVLERLKIQALTWRQFATAVGIVVGFLLLEIAIATLWSALDPQSYERISSATEGFFGGVNSFGLALSLAIATGIGEEVLFRGAVQPRFGLWFTSLAFALGHLQYGLSPALAQVFIMSLVLGLVRNKANTTTCIVIHALYNLADLSVMNWIS